MANNDQVEVLLLRLTSLNQLSIQSVLNIWVGCIKCLLVYLLDFDHWLVVELTSELLLTLLLVFVRLLGLFLFFRGR